MKKLIGTGIATLLLLTAFGQQEIQFTQFMNNKLFYNPGVAGSSGAICLNGVYRTQWVGFTNAPVTQNLNAEIPIEFIRGALIVNLTNDQIGFFQDITAGIGYAYTLDFGIGTLGLGFEVDFRNKSVTSGEWLPPDNLSDPALAGFNKSAISPDVNFGAYFQATNWYAGVSSTRLLAAQTDVENYAKDGVTSIKGVRHYILMGGYDWEIPNTSLMLRPAAMIKTDLLASPQVDLNVSALYNNKIWAGVSYRLQDAVAIMAGYYILPDLRLSYSYDLTTSSLRNASYGSHEIMLNYCFKIEIPPREKGYYRNVRFL